MPISLISDSQKKTISSIIDDIHETFARSITVYEEGKKVLININRQLKLSGFTGDNAHLNGTYTQQGTSATDFYQQEHGNGSISIEVTSIATEEDPNLNEFRWLILDSSDNDPADLASNTSTTSGGPTLQPYQMTWSGLTLTEFVVRDTFNGVYGRHFVGRNKTTKKTTVQHTIKARIKYINAREQNLADGNIGSQLDIDLIDGSVRITVDADGFDILKEAKRCEFEGRKYTINSKGNPTGIFGPQYYHFYLSPIEE